tara:strand:- start:14201 stop:15256 length:1056 start_codon:yes stop_codon:yes gene_type:complete
MRINFNTELAEDPVVAAALQSSLASLLGSVARGELSAQQVAPELVDGNTFFGKTLRALGQQPGAAVHAPLVLKSYSPDGASYLVTVAFFRAASRQPQIAKILEFHAYRDGDGYRFRSPFDHYNSLPSHEADGVTFHARAPFDEQRAREFVRFKSQLERLVHAPPSHLDYYCFHSLDELLKAHGILYDATKCNSLAQDLGFLDGDLFLTGTGDERYIFGYLRDYLYRHCNAKGDLYAPFVNGMAAYYGGYSLSGDDMPTLKRQFRAKLAANPDFDFLREFRLERKSSVNRHFTHYVICALLCEEVVTQFGFEQAMALAHSGKNGKDFFTKLHSILGVDETSFHALVARLIRT